MTAELTQSDVDQLLSDSSPTARVELATKLGRLYGQAELRDGERELAEEILRVLSRDDSETVRSAVAEQVEGTPNLPRDVILPLAADSAEISLPVLKWSQNLLESDLIPLIGNFNDDQRLAVARRQSLSVELVNALIANSGEAVVLRVLGNDGAEINDLTIERLLDEHGGSTWVVEILASRPSLPPTGARRILCMIVERLNERLRAGDSLALDDLSDTVLSIRQICVAGGSWKIANGEMDELIVQMHSCKRLEPSLLLRTLCLGDLQFFDMAIAHMADMPVKKAHRLIHNKGTLGLETVFVRTGLPEAFLPAVQIAVEVAAETKYEGAAAHRAQYVQRMLERMLNELDNPDEKIPVADIEYLLDKLQRSAA